MRGNAKGSRKRKAENALKTHGKERVRQCCTPKREKEKKKKGVLSHPAKRKKRRKRLERG